MSQEASKTYDIWSDSIKKLFQGSSVLDIGCGNSPITDSCKKFDLEDGDANHILDYVRETFDVVFSSHCLEHMASPQKCLADWWQLVKPGGVMIITVPDEDLYEQGVFPSRFNGDHKWTFTISKEKSWSAKSINLLALIRTLPQLKDYDISLQDIGYRRDISHFGKDRWGARAIRSLRYRILDRIPLSDHAKNLLSTKFYSVDQTLGGAFAQIQCILYKE